MCGGDIFVGTLIVSLGVWPVEKCLNGKEFVPAEATLVLLEQVATVVERARLDHVEPLVRHAQQLVVAQGGEEWCLLFFEPRGVLLQKAGEKLVVLQIFEAGVLEGFSVQYVHLWLGIWFVKGSNVS